MIVASIFEMVIGLTGIIGVMLQWLTLLVVFPTTSLVGLSLFEEVTCTASKNWGSAIMTVGFTNSQYRCSFWNICRNVSVDC
ncbi:solute carrier family 23 member 2-like [Tachypleus tridentatus]|uniref:solute carrier family 23 member 2-like n=1 Tax=Tachypleus tridentatus TaxID=6853 RepID=UPI003FD0F977